ncbi:MAG: carboxypeptidase-like regulatory domain-containing protein [bacterium]
MKTKSFILIFLLAVSTWLGGCSDNRNLTIKSADSVGVITGRVVDFSTRQPIGNAEVILQMGGNYRVTRTILDSNRDPNLNKTGVFTFNGVPAGEYTIKIVAAGYAVIQNNGSMDYKSYTNSNNPVVYDYGDIALYKGYNLDVYVNSNGTALSGIHIYTVVDDAICGYIGSNSWFYSPEITGTTDATGHATLSGLSQCERYAIVAPATDVNGDGIYDYQTGIAYSPNLPIAGSNMTVAVNMLPAQRYDGISVIATSTNNYPNLHYPTNWLYDWYAGYVYAGVAPQDDIVYVFNYPVSLDYFTLSYHNDKVVNTDPNYNRYLNAPITATLSAGNTVLTIHPTSNLVVNNTYKVSGQVSANIGGMLQTYEIGSYPMALWYVFDNTSTGLSSALSSSGFTVGADNFNGAVNSNVASQVYLKFPEFVIGTWKVLALTNAGTTIYYGAFGPRGVLAGSTNDSIYYEGNVGGCEGTTCPGTKVVYRVPLGINLADDSSLGGGASAVNNITVVIDATDVEGNRYVTPADGITLSIN